MAVLVSVVSFWEISLKYSIGKLDLGNVTPDNFPALVRQSGFDILPLADTDQKEDNSFEFWVISYEKDLDKRERR